MKNKTIKIQETPHEVDDRFFDFVGNESAFSSQASVLVPE